MMHGQHWRGQDVTGWLASEKLDGCCGYWHHERMWSRSGRAFDVPPAWRGKRPPMDLVGEIFAGRGNFKTTVDAVARNRWQPSVCFIIFDAPKAPGCWEERIAKAERHLRGCGFAGVVPYQRIKDVEHLAEIFRRVGYYSSERPEFEFARAREKVENRQSVEASIMDLADDIAYSVSDLEDFLRTGKIPLTRLALDRTQREAFVQSAQQALKEKHKTTFKQLLATFERLLRLLPIEHGYTGTIQERATIRTVSCSRVALYALRMRVASAL